MLTKVKELASDAFSAFHAGTRIPVRQEELARSCWPQGDCPKVEIAPRLAEVVVTFHVPGATPSNTQLVWDARLRTLSLNVEGTGRGARHRAVLGFTSDVDGSKGTAWLRAQTLTVRLPRQDIDTLTGLPAWLSSASLPAQLPLCT